MQGLLAGAREGDARTSWGGRVENDGFTTTETQQGGSELSITESFLADNDRVQGNVAFKNATAMRLQAVKSTGG